MMYSSNRELYYTDAQMTTLVFKMEKKQKKNEPRTE